VPQRLPDFRQVDHQVQGTDGRIRAWLLRDISPKEAIMILTAVVIVVVVAAFIYAVPLRRWFFRWGSSQDEVVRVMPGDHRVLQPTYSATLAVTVNTAPERIWPWLVQMGYRRGGLYSYDWLDRLFGYLDRPSANRIMPLFQHLEVGDEIPIGRAGGFPVVTVVPNHALVLGGKAGGTQWVWQFGLYPTHDGRTRLISRNAVRAPRTVGSWLFTRAIEPAAFLMTRRMLLGLKSRAETLENDRRPAIHAA
jgi:hypothetical protein